MSASRSSAHRTNERLRERRKRQRKALRIVVGILCALGTAGMLYGLQSEHIRIAHIEVYGTDEPLVPIAQEALIGSYGWIIPRNSTLFYPEDDIRARILSTYGDIATVSFFRNGLTGLTIRVTNRVPIARWCGSVYTPRVSTSTQYPECFYFDDQGRLFATSTTQTVVHETYFFTALPGAPAAGVTIPHAEQLPALFNFAREVGTLGTRAYAVERSADAVVVYLESGTHLIYRAGGEQAAFTALQSAKGSLDIADGSLSYVDLRFEGRLYLKRADSDTVEE